MGIRFSHYDPEGFYDELYEEKGRPRPGSTLLLRKFASLPEGELKNARKRRNESFSTWG